ncbi:MAG TPA: hypothetical protein VHQ47_04600 [Phycisphaerae bacterium]|nr:hypothetical protein [Phycisphaerae bacterium]
MKAHHITYGELASFLRDRGFTRTVSAGSHVAYRHPSSPASLLLPIEGNDARVNTLHLAMAKRMLVDFGFMTDEQVDRWLADPTSTQAA